MRDEHLWTALRLTLAVLLAAHGWARLLAGGVEPFGIWLNAQGFVIGTAIAWGVTLYEIVGTVLLAAKRFVFPLAVGFSLVYLAGLILVHWPEGWFVVGLGRNGMEYSVVLIVLLLCVGTHYRNPRQSQGQASWKRGSLPISPRLKSRVAG
jgi:putative oxidoreductase